MPVSRKSLKNLRNGRAADAEPESLAGKAYELIRDEILRGNLAVGDILSRRRLADRLQMSFLPITEALQRLEAEGLVESRPRIGTRVRIPTRQDILDSYVIREALETQAARLCCEHMVDAEKRELILRAQHLDNLYAASSLEPESTRFHFSVHTYHMQFHMHIAELARSPGLLRAIEREQVLIFNWLYDIAARQNTLPANFHFELTKAICSGNRAKADAEMRRHIRYGRDNVVESISTLEISRSWRHKRNTR